MKMVSSFFNSHIEFQENHVQSIVLENQRTFLAFVTDMQEQLEGVEGETVLSVDATPVAMSARLCLSTNFVPFILSTKELIAATVKRLEKTAVAGDRYGEMKDVLARIKRFVNECALELPHEIELEKLSIGALLKACGVSIAEDGLPLLEKIVLYMKLVRELVGERLFVFVNLRSFLDDSAMERLFDDIFGNKFEVLLVESSERKLLPGEKRLLVDDNLCEIISPDGEEI